MPAMVAAVLLLVDFLTAFGTVHDCGIGESLLVSFVILSQNANMSTKKSQKDNLQSHQDMA